MTGVRAPKRHDEVGLQLAGESGAVVTSWM
jgi:hypothetical protein